MLKIPICFSTSSSMARVGSVLAPIIGREVAKYNRDAVIVIFAVVALISGSLTLFLPETNGKSLPDTIEEGLLKYPLGHKNHMQNCSFITQVKHLVRANRYLMCVAREIDDRLPQSPKILALKMRRMQKNSYFMTIGRLLNQIKILPLLKLEELRDYLANVSLPNSLFTFLPNSEFPNFGSKFSF